MENVYKGCQELMYKSRLDFIDSIFFSLFAKIREAILALNFQGVYFFKKK